MTSMDVLRTGVPEDAAAVSSATHRSGARAGDALRVVFVEESDEETATARRAVRTWWLEAADAMTSSAIVEEEKRCVRVRRGVSGAAGCRVRGCAIDDGEVVD
jgi:hypothetical protein